MKHVFKLTALIMLAVLTSCDLDELNETVKSNFSFSPKIPEVNQEVNFISEAENAKLFSWDFGDGNVSAEENPTHIYKKVGDYMVTLTATAENGATDETTKVIRVVPTGEGGGEEPGSTIVHDKDITANETWSNKYLHIVKYNVEIIDAVLTIEPGTIVKFNDDAALIFGYSSNVSHSKLVAQGTADSLITFTANKTSPQQASWDYIYFGKSASHESIMEYCNISYAGNYSDYYGSVVLDGTNIIFNNNTVKHSGTTAITCIYGGYFGSFTGNTVSENVGSSVKIAASYAHTLGANNNLANTQNGIVVYDDFDNVGDFTWLNHGARYTLTTNVNIGSVNGTSLTIEKGITVAFKEGAELTIGYDDNKSGKLTAVGTETEPIRFISAKANSSAGDWDYIYFGKFNDPDSKMEYCEIDAGGGYSSYYGSVVVEETKITFNNNTVTNSSSYGITLYDGSSFNSFTGNKISNSAKSSIKIPANWAHTIGENNNIAHDMFGIELYDDFNHQNQSYTWLKQTCPYTLISDVEIGSAQGCTLTIEPGTTIQVADDYELLVGYSSNIAGTLIAEGTSDNKITFTSASPTGSWDYFYFGEGTMSGTILNNCIVNNGGNYSSNYGAIVCDEINASNTPVIKNTHISNSKSHGIYIDSCTPLLENNTFENNTGDDVHYY